jgi:alkaline phosphatase
MPIISANFQMIVPWRNGQELSRTQRERLISLVNQIHHENKKLRFWNTRDENIFWELLQDIGVDIIGTDHIQELNQFLISKYN